MPFAIEPMHVEDIPDVSQIERECFSMPWPASAYRRELRDNQLARYIVARQYPDAGIQGGSTSPGVGPREERKERRIFPFRLFNAGAPRAVEDPVQVPIVGYGGLWLMVDEAHVTTLAVSSSYRGRGIGELLLVGLIDVATEMGATWMTLEVRVSNHIAQNLYRKYWFKEAGIRRKYYSDNNEDGLIMWSEPLASAAYQQHLQELKAALGKRLGVEESDLDGPHAGGMSVAEG
jgi:[ribosomal protein S18]-alanine N-acetyltransferase